MKRGLAIIALALVGTIGLVGGATAAHEGSDFWLFCQGLPISCEEQAVPTVTETQTETETDTETITVTETETQTETDPTETQPTEPEPPNGPIVCTTENWEEWGPTYEPGECVVGTTINVPGNQATATASWRCDRPLSQYGPLPILVVITTTVPRPVGSIGAEAVTGCNNPEGTAINLIVEQYVTGVGRISDPFKTRMAAPGGPQNLRMTGSLNASGPLAVPGTGDHQDCIQVQSNGNNFFVNVDGCGDWDAGTSNTQAAGGTHFLSFNNPKGHVRGGRYLGCNAGFLADSREFGSGIAESTVIGAGFRTIGPNKADSPWCATFHGPGNPCAGASLVAQFEDVICQRWNGTSWEDRTPS